MLLRHVELYANRVLWTILKVRECRLLRPFYLLMLLDDNKLPQLLFVFSDLSLINGHKYLVNIPVYF